MINREIMWVCIVILLLIMNCNLFYLVNRGFYVTAEFISPTSFNEGDSFLLSDTKGIFSFYIKRKGEKFWSFVFSVPARSTKFPETQKILDNFDRVEDSR